MLTIEQCRAARGLLGWTQQDLADASGLSKTAINNFEKGHSDIKAESLRAIHLAFESGNIELIGREGVSKKTDTMEILRGSTALNELLDDIHKTLENRIGEILISYADQAMATRLTTQKLFEHIEFLKDNNIRERIICFEDSKHILSPTDEYRWVMKDTGQFGTTTFIYGDKVAFELWDKSTIIVTNCFEASQAERSRFEEIWQTALIPEKNTTEQSLLLQTISNNT